MSPSKVNTARPRRKAVPRPKAVAFESEFGAAAGEESPEQVLRAFARVRPEPLSPPGISLPYPQGGWRAVGFLLSLCQPAVGLLLAFLYWPSTEGRARRFSRWCLILAMVGLAVLCVFGAAWAVLRSGDTGVQAW